jgi:MFS family permease
VAANGTAHTCRGVEKIYSRSRCRRAAAPYVCRIVGTAPTAIEQAAPRISPVNFRALDALNFCNAGIQTGLGPFIAIFYGSARHWDPGRIGVLLACQSFAGIFTQAVIGNLVDQSRHKRLLTAMAALTVTAGALGIALLPGYAPQIAVQAVIGFATTVFPAATTAFALGLVGRDDLPRRLARNEMFTHGGNVAFALVAGVVGTLLALAGIFYAAAIFAAGMAGAVVFIRESEIDYEGARAGGPPGKDGAPAPRRSARELFRDRRVLMFTAAVVLFNVSNAATLSLVSQIFGHRRHGAAGSWQTAAAVVVAEAVMVVAAGLTGRRAAAHGRKPLFVAAFAVLAVRNALGIVSHAPTYLIALQAMDGVAAAIYGVLLKLVTADLAAGTGRFNFLQGTVQSAMGLGAFLSNLGFGLLAGALGFNASFAGLAVMALAGGALYLLKMPETRPETPVNSRLAGSPAPRGPAT